MMHIDYLKTPAGILKITGNEKRILSIRFTDAEGPASPGTLTQKCAAQLSEYFEGKRTAFDLPLKMEGTAFQQRVWRALLEIPYGETKSYADIARAVRSPLAMRAVGGANARNPFAIVVPCHRVVQSNGKIGGYAGGVWRKEILLAHEAACKKVRPGL